MSFLPTWMIVHWLIWTIWCIMPLLPTSKIGNRFLTALSRVFPSTCLIIRKRWSSLNQISCLGLTESSFSSTIVSILIFPLLSVCLSSLLTNGFFSLFYSNFFSVLPLRLWNSLISVLILRIQIIPTFHYNCLLYNRRMAGDLQNSHFILNPWPKFLLEPLCSFLVSIYMVRHKSGEL